MKSDNLGFIDTFVGSFYALREYPRYAERPLWSLVLHYALLIFLATCIYTTVSARFITRRIEPEAAKLIRQVPDISVVKGHLRISIKQPYVIRLDKQPVAVVDTIDKPAEVLKKYDQIVLVGASKLYFKAKDAPVKAVPITGNHTINKAIAERYYQRLKHDAGPFIFLVVFVWQSLWKCLEALLVAGLVTSLCERRPDFSVCARLAFYALGPAVAFGLLIFVLAANGVFIPFAWLGFWGILLWVTLRGARLVAGEMPPPEPDAE